jgi:hypothetical protein
MMHSQNAALKKGMKGSKKEGKRGSVGLGVVCLQALAPPEEEALMGAK